MIPKSFACFRFDLGPLLQGQMWFFIPKLPIMVYISLVIGRRGFGCDNLQEIMCPKSFGGVRFDIGSLLQGQMWYLIPMIDNIYYWL